MKSFTTCPECGLPVEEPFNEEQDLYSPCPICGATLKDQETGECVFCRTP